MGINLLCDGGKGVQLSRLAQLYLARQIENEVGEPLEFWDLQAGVGRPLMPGTGRFGQHWTGRVAATELAMSRCDGIASSRSSEIDWKVGRRASGVFGFDRHVLIVFSFSLPMTAHLLSC
jgi:hypothetical protein